MYYMQVQFSTCPYRIELLEETIVGLVLKLLSEAESSKEMQLRMKVSAVIGQFAHSLKGIFYKAYICTMSTICKYMYIVDTCTCTCLIQYTI